MNKNVKRAAATLPLVRCAVYTRKSTEEGLEQEFNSLDAKREACEAFIASQRAEGWSCLPDRYDDGGFTGGNMDRPALRRLLNDIEAGKIDCVVVYKVDRLSRSLLDFARMIETFDKARVSFVSVTQQFNTATSMGRLILNVLLSFTQFEREIISERPRDKMAATRRKGKWSGVCRCSVTTSIRKAIAWCSTRTRRCRCEPSSSCIFSTSRCCRSCKSWRSGAGRTSGGQRGLVDSAAAGRSRSPACTGC
jgi:DNA invertase Pin-like site-specific DNA recombinase